MFRILKKMNLSRQEMTRPLTLIFIVGFVLTSAYYISAQEDTRPDRSNRGEQGRGNRGGERRGEFNLEEMVERQTQRTIEELNLV